MKCVKSTGCCATWRTSASFSFRDTIQSKHLIRLEGSTEFPSRLIFIDFLVGMTPRRPETQAVACPKGGQKSRKRWLVMPCFASNLSLPDRKLKKEFSRAPRGTFFIVFLSRPCLSVQSALREALSFPPGKFIFKTFRLPKRNQKFEAVACQNLLCKSHDQIANPI